MEVKGEPKVVVTERWQVYIHYVDHSTFRLKLDSVMKRDQIINRR